MVGVFVFLLSKYLQILVHLFEGLLGLREEVVDDGFGEFALFFVVVHF